MLPLVLSIQSHVAYGHAGNSAAVFPLQRLGVETMPVHTVQFSNHTGYGAFRGSVFDAAHLQDIFLGLDERGILPDINAVLSGYMGASEIGDAILEVVGKIKQANPNAIYVCDPVFGDIGRGIFVHPSIAQYHRNHTVAEADIITPNQFEFEQLTGVTLQSMQQAIKEARKLIASSNKTVIITSLVTQDIPQNHLRSLAVNSNAAWSVETPILPKSPTPNGMGDAFSAILLAQILHGNSLPTALERATSSLYALVSKTQDGQRDLPLISHQDEIIKPTMLFSAHQVD